MADNDYKAAEAAAPVDQKGPLPRNVTTLAYIPAEHRNKYARTMEGAFRLSWINTDDPHYTEYVDDIASQRMTLVPPGRTLYEIQELEKQQAQMQQKAWDELARLEEREKQERLARLKAEQEKKAAELQAEYERREQSYRRR